MATKPIEGQRESALALLHCQLEDVGTFLDEAEPVHIFKDGIRSMISFYVLKEETIGQGDGLYTVVFDSNLLRSEDVRALVVRIIGERGNKVLFCN